jgi:hypothetical protein
MILRLFLSLYAVVYQYKAKSFKKHAKSADLAIYEKFRQMHFLFFLNPREIQVWSRQ